MRPAYVAALVAVCLAALILSIGRYGGLQSAEADWHAENVAKVTAAYRVQRDSTAAASARVDTITRVVIRQGTRIDSVVNIADTVLATDTANTATLRATLSMLRTEVVTYRVTVDSLLDAHRMYIVATDHALVMADSTIGRLKDVVAAERNKRWRYRGEGLVGGIVTAALIVLLL
jgi:hypothetical protein